MRSRREGTQSTGRHSVSFVLSAVLLAIILVTGAVLAIVRLTDAADTVSGENFPVIATPKSDESEECPESYSMSDPDLSSLAGVRWSLAGTVAAPSIGAVGPLKAAPSGLPHCFAQSPAGAIIAAANYVAWGSGRPELGAELAALAIAPGLGRDAAIENSEGASTQESASLQIAGYRLDVFSPELTRVALAVALDDGSYASGELRLTWIEGDWKLIADPGTGRTAVLESIQSLGGFTPWGAR